MQRFRLLDAPTEPQKRLIEKMTRMLEVRRQLIYLPGDPSDQIFLLKVGVVKISTEAPGLHQTILAPLYPANLRRAA